MTERRLEHRHERIAWLRAAVLGANDGILTLSSLMLGVESAAPSGGNLTVVGIAGLLSGTLAMAAGEYVSVRSQADAEAAELEVERFHLSLDYAAERRELAAIYRARGLDNMLADQVAGQLMDHDALGAHARDELGLTDTLRARPVVASVTSGLSFAAGGAVPLAIAASVAGPGKVACVAATSLVCLCGLGSLAARAGGAPILKGALRVVLWGVASMAATTAVGFLLRGLHAF